MGPLCQSTQRIEFIKNNPEQIKKDTEKRVTQNG